MNDLELPNPSDFSNKLGCDIYLNPWWGIATSKYMGKQLARQLRSCLGEPDLWFHGNMFHELLWGPRDLPRVWRPGFKVNLSGTNGRVWRNFWLPWRISEFQHDGKSPHGAEANEERLVMQDLLYVEKYAKLIPVIREWLRTGDVVSEKDFQLAFSGTLE